MYNNNVYSSIIYNNKKQKKITSFRGDWTIHKTHKNFHVLDIFIIMKIKQAPKMYMTTHSRL